MPTLLMPTRRQRTRLLAAVAAAAALLAFGCNGATSPTAPAMTLQLVNAQVLLNGQVVNGMTMHAGRHSNHMQVMVTIASDSGQ